MFSGVWLIFLGLPIAAVLTSPDDTPTAKAFGVAMIAAFAATYLASFSWPRPIKPLPLPANTFLQTLLLTAFTALAVPTAGPSITGMVPFIMALWMFTHRVLLGMSVAFIIGLAGTFTAFMLADGEAGFSLIAPIFFAGGILTMFRLAFEHTEVERQYSERVALAEQREELARAVHDALSHSLTPITVQVQLARRLVTADHEAPEKQLDGILSTARDSLRDVRSTVESIDAPPAATSSSPTSGPRCRPPGSPPTSPTEATCRPSTPPTGGCSPGACAKRSPTSSGIRRRGTAA